MRYLLWVLLVLLVIYRQVTSRPIYSQGDRVRITTRVNSEPILYQYSQGLTIASLKVYLPSYPEISYGDRIIVEGVVQDNKLLNPILVEVKEAKGFFYQFRKKLMEVYQKSLPEPHSSLIAGVTLGSKAAIPPDFWEALKKTGTAHVVVASGMNVTLVAGFLINLLVIFLPRKKAIPTALLGIWGYSLISGFDAPIIRAAIMGSVAFSAQSLGRLYDAWRALVISALGMLIIKPSWLTDLGFILSFVATVSLILFETRVRKWVSWAPKVIREDFSTSLAAQIGVAPIIWATFGQFNILSPVVNALILWAIAPMTIIGMVGGLVGLIVPEVSRLILFIIYPMSSWFVGVVNAFS